MKIIKSGDSINWAALFTLTFDGVVQTSLDDYTAKCGFCDSNGRLLAEVGVQITGTVGHITVPSATTASWPEDQICTDVRLFGPDGLVITTATGVFKVIRSSTRSITP